MIGTILNSWALFSGFGLIMLAHALQGTLLNINANYSASARLDIYLRLDNLLDEDYEEVFGYQTLGFGASLGLRFDL